MVDRAVMEIHSGSQTLERSCNGDPRWSPAIVRQARQARSSGPKGPYRILDGGFTSARLVGGFRIGEASFMRGIMTCVVSASRFAFSTRLCSCSSPRVSPSSSFSLRSWNRNSNPFTSASMSESAESNSVPPPEDGGAKAEEIADVLIQYVVLRRDLIDSWPLGSVVTQGCHASVSAIWFNKDDPHTADYCSPHNIDSMHKVTLEVKGEAQMVNLSEKLKANSIVHKLWIEQPENIPTCLATKPYPKSVVSPFFKKLKLCK